LTDIGLLIFTGSLDLALFEGYWIFD